MARRASLTRLMAATVLVAGVATIGAVAQTRGMLQVLTCDGALPEVHRVRAERAPSPVRDKLLM